MLIFVSQHLFKNMKLSSEKISCILSRNKVTSSYIVIKRLFVNLIKGNRCYIWIMFTKMHVTNYRSVSYGARTRYEIIKQLKLCVFWKVKTPYKHLKACVSKLSPAKNWHELNFRCHRIYSELRYEFRNSSLRSW